MRDLIELTASAEVPTYSLPPHVAAQVRLLGGTVEHPGQRTRHHMAAGVTLPESIREEARNLLSTLSSTLNPAATFAGRTAEEAKIGVVTMLLLGLAKAAGTSPEEAEAKFDLYELALSDIPAWAVAAGAVKWAKGKCPETIEKSPRYSFPPSPATLRALAEWELSPYQTSVRDLTRLVESMPVERALDPRPIAAKALGGPDGTVPQLRRM
jgi:hypothetical protein